MIIYLLGLGHEQLQWFGVDTNLDKRLVFEISASFQSVVVDVDISSKTSRYFGPLPGPTSKLFRRPHCLNSMMKVYHMPDFVVTIHTKGPSQRDTYNSGVCCLEFIEAVLDVRDQWNVDHVQTMLDEANIWALLF